MTAQPVTITIVTSYALYGAGWERYYYNGTLAYNGITRGEGGEFVEGVTATIHHLVSLGALDAVIENVNIEHTWDYEGSSTGYLHWVTEQSIKQTGKIDFMNLEDLLNAVEADPNLEISRYTD